MIFGLRSRCVVRKVDLGSVGSRPIREPFVNKGFRSAVEKFGHCLRQNERVDRMRYSGLRS